MFDISEYFQIAQNKTKKNIIETINCVIIKEGKKLSNNRTKPFDACQFILLFNRTICPCTVDQC